MNKLLFVFILLAFCFASAGFAQTQENSYLLRGVFKNQDSEVIPGLTMIFKSSGRETVVSTDINGDFKTALAPGSYELTVSKTISDKFIAFINIQENGLNPDFIEFIVETDSNSRTASCPKIIKFIKPVYPAAARAVRASGYVVVDVKINQEGNVVSSKAVSGHPLLRTGSEQAALKSAFEPSENAVERDAKLSYVFFDDYASEKKNIKRYSIPCTMEIIADSPQPIDVSDTK